jgi:hemolysin activation/secretion protein
VPAAAIFAGSLFAPSLASAQSPISPLQPPGTAARTQIEQRESEERRRPLPGLNAGIATNDRADADGKPLFRLHSVELVGVTALPADVLAATYADRIGRDVSQADLIAIAAGLGDAYRRAGYHLSRAIVPPQDLKGGRLRIQVIEGSIEDIVVRGDESGVFGVQALLAPIADERPARLATLERRLLLANDRPGVRVTDTALDEIVPASGRFRVTVSVQPWRVYTATGIDNTGSSAVGPWQASASVALNALILPGDSLALSGSFAPGSSRELRFGRASYDVPLGVDSLRIGVAASRSEVWPGDRRRLLGAVSQAETYTVRTAFAPLLTRTHALWLTASLGMSDIAERNRFGRVYSDRFGLASLSADYKLQLSEGAWTYLSTTYRHGLGFIDPHSDNHDWLSRDRASGRFSRLNASLTHYQNLAENWSLKLAAAGQLASGRLLSSQQYYLGGLSFGRGFEGGWLAGDNALAGSAELRFDRSLGLAFAKGYQLYGFVEGGVTRSYRQPKDLVQGLASIGLGARLFVNDNLQVGIAIARPVAQHSPVRWNRGTTVLFSLSNALRFCPTAPNFQCG